MNVRTNMIILLAAGLLAGSSYLLIRSEWSGEPEDDRLYLLCDEAMRLPIEDIVGSFQRRTGIRMRVEFVESESIIERVRGERRGDLFLPVDPLHMRQARDLEWVAAEEPIAAYEAVIFVRAANPLGITSPFDLARPGVTLALAAEDVPGIGPMTGHLMRAFDLPRRQIELNTVVRSRTVQGLCQAVAAGQVDASIVTRPVARLFTERGQIVDVPGGRNPPTVVSIATLRTARQKEAADEFVAFLRSTAARDFFHRHQYLPVPGDSPDARF